MFGLLPFGFSNVNPSIGAALQDIFQNFFNGDIMADFNTDDMFKTAIKETPEAYMICAELHGVKKEDIKISYKDNNFTISIIKRSENEQSGSNFRIVQRAYGGVARSFYVENVNINSMKAMFKNGILIVGIPKKGRYVYSDNKVLIE